LSAHLSPLSMPAALELLAMVPWILFAVAVPFLIRLRPRLDGSSPPQPGEAPLVSVIVPARNEAANIGACVASLLTSVYPRFEIIVVDDGSIDGTTDIARILAERSHGAIRLIEGEPLPAGWLGKCWACWQGYLAARGELLVFTDADTRHDEDLLGHAVGALRGTGAGLVSVFPRQLMQSFWERVILPHIFTMISLRYRDPRRINRTRNARDVIANGQFILIGRDVYEGIGGHRALSGEVVEDLRLAQSVVAHGRRVYLAHAEDLIETRMYRSLGGIVEGWSKNLAAGARATVDPWLRPVLPWLLGGLMIGFWTLPPALLAASLFATVDPGTVLWAATVTAVSLVFWTFMHARLRISLLHAAFFPLGGLLAGALFLGSALGGQRIRWKGRSYVLGGARADDRPARDGRRP
ncbi:MAG: glycosyltransferase, partial [Longimicrobiales bacterium]